MIIIFIHLFSTSPLKKKRKEKKQNSCCCAIAKRFIAIPSKDNKGCEISTKQQPKSFIFLYVYPGGSNFGPDFPRKLFLYCHEIHIDHHSRVGFSSFSFRADPGVLGVIRVSFLSVQPSAPLNYHVAIIIACGGVIL